MMLKVFTLTVLVALVWLVVQQFPQGALDALKWAEAPTVEIGERVGSQSWEDISTDPVELVVPATTETLTPRPQEWSGSMLADVGDSADYGFPNPIPDLQGTKIPTVSMPEMHPQPSAFSAWPEQADAEYRIEEETVQIRRDALAALAERMEMLAIQRAQ